MNNSDWHIAQINVGTSKYALDDDRMIGFMSQLDAINAIAEQSPGFVWRLKSDSGNATDIDVGSDDPLFIVNMSVWSSVESLFDYVYKSSHRGVMVDRRQWFEKPSDAYQCLWWVKAGHIPAPAEGLERLALLNRDGPSPRVFNFKSKFPPPGVQGEPSDLKPEPYCSGWK